MWSRFASAAARAARACPTAAVSSSAESSATTSPARTRSPLRTLMAASWPPTSGATRTSVVRTTPTMGADSDRHRRYPPAPAETRTKPSALMVTPPRVGMAAPPPDEKRREHREREISDGEQPEAPPVVRHLPQARAQLVDAHEAVDREIRREDGAGGEHRLGDCFARPGEPGQKKLRQA